jgi:hypothetical protein
MLVLASRREGALPKSYVVDAPNSEPAYHSHLSSVGRTSRCTVKHVVTEFLVLIVILLAAFLGWFCQGCSPDRPDCTSTCIDKGWAQTASVCTDDPFIRVKKCGNQTIRSPRLGEAVLVSSSSEDRTTIVVSILGSRAFSVGGPQSDAELGSGIIALEDRALLGIVESVDGDLSICSEVESEE